MPLHPQILLGPGHASLFLSFFIPLSYHLTHASRPRRSPRSENPSGPGCCGTNCGLAPAPGLTILPPRPSCSATTAMSSVRNQEPATKSNRAGIPAGSPWAAAQPGRSRPRAAAAHARPRPGRRPPIPVRVVRFFRGRSKPPALPSASVLQQNHPTRMLATAQPTGVAGSAPLVCHPCDSRLRRDRRVIRG